MKTKCTCGICGFETIGNCKWETEYKMWGHIIKEHPNEVLKFNEEKKKIGEQIDKLQKSIPSLYSTEQKGKTMKGSWTI